MEFDYRLLKAYLKNVYFINGTTFAGKSTVCKALAKKYDMIHCEENYQLKKFLSLSTANTQPNLNYFNTMESYEGFVSRSKEAYTDWMDSVSLELAPFEILELISLAKDKPVIVDTNIPHHILKEIASENRVVYMVATQSIAMEYFFDRADQEKQFLLNVIKGMENNEAALDHFKSVITYANSEKRINTFKETCFPYIERHRIDEPIEEKIDAVAKLFKLSD